MRKSILILAVILAGCFPPIEPCSEADAGAKLAACIVRVQTECKPLPDGKKDTNCPAFVECKKTFDQWEACP